ncbi:hypothetical protein [Actinospica robiniae]|uniref:hypothetical protein n=1 Tax=Actinospica robiniae TaxID=304901 RepID=UPI00041B57EB|nr:hypothetical protein [Actinospica robiniae]
MDVETIDRNYEQLQEQGQQTVRALSALAAKLQRAVEAGDPNAREWLLDLKEVALEVRTEQAQVGQLLQSLHTFVANHIDDEARYDRPPTTGYQSQQPYPPQPPQYRQQYQDQYQQQYQQQGYGQGGGGAFSRFMGSGFGQAIAMGAGLEIGEDLIDDIFG